MSGDRRIDSVVLTDLPEHSSDHDVSSIILPLSSIGTTREPSASGLNDERDDVSRNGDDGVGRRVNPGILLSQDLHETAEQDVITGGEKGGSDDQAADLHDESVEAVEGSRCGAISDYACVRVERITSLWGLTLSTSNHPSRAAISSRLGKAIFHPTATTNRVQIR